MAGTIEIKVGLDTKQAERELDGFKGRFKSGIDSSTASVTALRGALVGLGVAGVAALKELADQAVRAAVEIDKTRKTLVALTGSIEAANRKLAELRQLAAASPGVTTSFATQLFSQLKAIGEISDQTINRLIGSIGRLNAVFSIENPTGFSRNLTQIFQQGFERSDIKEAIGQVPIFEQILKQAFGTNNPDALRKLKASGKLSLDAFLQGISEAIADDPRFKGIQDSMASQFEKLKDRINTALAPIGEEILKVLIPIIQDLVKELEKVAPVITKIFKDNQGEIKALASTFGELASSIETLGTKFLGLDGKLNLVRNSIRAILAQLSLVTAGAALPLAVGFERNLSTQDAAESAEAARQTRRNRNLPFGLTLDSLVSEFSGILPPVPGGGDPTNKAASAEARKKAEKLKKDIQEIRIKLVDATLGLAIQDLEQLDKELTANRAEFQQDLARPGQLASFSAAVAEKARKFDVETARLEQNTLRQQASELQRTSRRGLTRSGSFVDDALNRGQITQAEAQLLNQSANRDYAARLREVLAIKEQLLPVNDQTLDDLRDEIELYDRLGASVSDAERFMRGFNSATISVGDAFERFGQNVSQALLNTKDLLGGLKQALLSFFNDLLGSSLQNLMRQVLGPLVGGIGGAFGGPQFAGAAGNIFRTASTFPASIAQAFAGDGISVPASVSGASGIAGAIGAATRPRTVTGAAGSAGSTAAGGIFGGLSLGGITRSLGAAAPFLGLSIGAGLGGQSRLGQVAGLAGGAVVGAGIGVATGAITSPAIISLFTNPFTLPLGIGALVGSIFLGKASQRKKDEESSGQFLTQALQAIDQLALAVQSGQVDGSQARQIFDSQILATFKQQISGLKTKSVRDSRLTNQVRDLQKVFDARIPPLIAEQQQKAADSARFASIDRRLVPEFASGGFVPGINRGFDSVIARVTPGEVILNKTQQDRVMAQSNPNVFRNAGVPSFNTSGRFADGGFVSTGGQSGQTIVIEELHIDAVVDAEGIAIRGLRGEKGRQITVNHIKVARTNREL